MNQFALTGPSNSNFQWCISIAITVILSDTHKICRIAKHGLRCIHSFACQLFSLQIKMEIDPVMTVQDNVYVVAVSGLTKLAL